jgi:hypothetical protein
VSTIPSNAVAFFPFHRMTEDRPRLEGFHQVTMSTWYRTQPDLHAVCETEIGPPGISGRPLQYFDSNLAQAWTSQSSVNTYSCPDGHVTHDFLSCDVRSACLARDEMSALTCEPPLSPAPPMLTCNSGLQRVPYSLVCDFVPDCADKSDEDFCEFAPCPIEDTMRCGNKQVGKTPSGIMKPNLHCALL